MVRCLLTNSEFVLYRLKENKNTFISGTLAFYYALESTFMVRKLSTLKVQATLHMEFRTYNLEHATL